MGTQMLTEQLVEMIFQ